MLLAQIRRMDKGQTHTLSEAAHTAKIALPHLDIIRKVDNFSSNDLNELIRDAMDASRRRPVYLEVADDDRQCFLFFRQYQIYSAGLILSGQIDDTSIKDFLVAVNRMDRATATCCSVNNKILHSILILFQKKPTLKLLSSLVDLDQVLDKIEDERKSCIVSASQNEFLALLRYEKGGVKALAHGLSFVAPKEKTFRDDFLIKIYTLSAEQPLTINIYEDLLVTYASDAKMIDENYGGDITDLFLSKPPTVTLEFKGKEIGQWAVDKPLIKIGRTADNDIVVDNLAVSRNHAVIEEEKGTYYLKDCDSLNGTVLNGERVGRAALAYGDEIKIGKHKLVFQKQHGRETNLQPDIEEFDQTVVMSPQKAAALLNEENSNDATAPRLVEICDAEDRVIEIGNTGMTIGKDDKDDVRIDGFLVAKHHAEITRENGFYVIRHINGFRKVTVGGKAVKKRILRDNDSIRIGANEFVFHE
ncbi:MAG: FHA domain-containing protein [Candidatus Latescibacterota bacterium]|nr:MAG: FHA domain-containing protein [Candidatus Latescibacterota bacterium]